MANKVTPDDILQMNTLYLELKTYAAVARKTGFSAGTVKKYIIPNFSIPKEKIIWNGELQEPGSFIIQKTNLTQEEKLNLEELRKELDI